MHPKRIYHVDDDEDSILLLRKAFNASQLPVSVIPFFSAAMALNHLCTLTPDSAPDLIVLDLYFPAFDGRDFLGHLRKHPTLQRLPVTVLTYSSLASDETLCEAFDSEMLTKPYSFKEWISMATWMYQTHLADSGQEKEAF